jgi:uncharacterized protein YdiU (UPF0061 family)
MHACIQNREHTTKPGHRDAYEYTYVHTHDQTPNHSDDMARYTYSKQPEVCRWNCQKLAEALAPVSHKFMISVHQHLGFDNTVDNTVTINTCM